VLLTLAVSWVVTLCAEATQTGAYTAVGSPPFANLNCPFSLVGEIKDTLLFVFSLADIGPELLLAHSSQRKVKLHHSVKGKTHRFRSCGDCGRTPRSDLKGSKPSHSLFLLSFLPCSRVYRLQLPPSPPHTPRFYHARFVDDTRRGLIC
jgi:hypothetical protein